jgi:hypothetical protein
LEIFFSTKAENGSLPTHFGEGEGENMMP